MYVKMKPPKRPGMPRKPAPKKKPTPLPKQYDAPPGSKREALIRKASKMYKSGNKKGAFALRNKMEAVNARKKSKK